MIGQERERLATVEAQIRDLAGNGQPGRIGRIEERIEHIEGMMDKQREAQTSQSRYIYIGIGILGALQFVAPFLLKTILKS